LEDGEVEGGSKDGVAVAEGKQIPAARAIRKIIKCGFVKGEEVREE
jgi:hypothetical protein